MAIRSQHFPSVAAAIGSCLRARANCLQSQPINLEWSIRWRDALDAIARDLLPRGSGIDNGTTIDVDASKADRIVLGCEFHRMDEHGSYAGWYSYRVIVRPAFDGLSIDIKGRNTPEDIKGYLFDTYDYALSLPAVQSADPDDRDRPATWQAVYPEPIAAAAAGGGQ